MDVIYLVITVALFTTGVIIAIHNLNRRVSSNVLAIVAIVLLCLGVVFCILCLNTHFNQKEISLSEEQVKMMLYKTWRRPYITN